MSYQDPFRVGARYRLRAEWVTNLGAWPVGIVLTYVRYAYSPHDGHIHWFVDAQGNPWEWIWHYRMPDDGWKEYWELVT